MNQQDMDLLLQWKRKQFVKLNEVLSATEQLADSMDRNDRVSVSMWISMRDEPIRQAQELQDLIGDYLLRMPQEDAIRANELLNGAEASVGDEDALCNQVAQNRRLLDRIVKLDRVVSERFGGAHSFYQKFR